MKKFRWTDRAAIAFVNVYSGNFNKTTPTTSTYAKYAGLKMEEKLKVFKRDWVEAEPLVCPCCKNHAV
jgi:hypothetical protein|tara:strand:+ start:1750 stop:1953 length:204 start_codon:yes stop_codon:yes gene_type:complete